MKFEQFGFDFYTNGNQKFVLDEPTSSSVRGVAVVLNGD